jgi:Ca-activated chloride channel homolog
MGLEEVTRHFDARGINRVVLLSDGVPNDATMIRPLAQAAGERQIAITALGLGLDYDEVLLGDVAVASGGRFHYLAESNEVAAVFREEVLRMTRTVARNVTVELAPGPGVTIASVVGPAFSSSGGHVYVSVGNLAEGEVRDILVRMNVEGRRDGAAVELFDTRMSFDDAAFDAGHFERTLYLGARSTDSDEELASGRDSEVERDAARFIAAAAARFIAAAVTVEAIRLARGGEIDRARQILAEATVVTRAYADSSGDTEMAGRAERMAALDSYLPSISPSPAPAAAYGGEGTTASTTYEYDEAETEDAVRTAHDDAMETLSGGW